MGGTGYCLPYKINTTKTMASIIVNGEKKEVNTPISVTEVINISNVFQPEMVSVQVNEEFVEKEDYDNVLLNDGDSIYMLYYM